MNVKQFALAAGLLALTACGDNDKNQAALKGANFVSQQPGATITLSFDPDEMRVNGRVVNLYNGPYSIDGNKIVFGTMATTMMMGPQDAMETEQEYFQFIPTVETYEYRDGKLVLTGVGGKEIIFQQVDVIPEAE